MQQFPAVQLHDVAAPRRQEMEALKRQVIKTDVLVVGSRGLSLRSGFLVGMPGQLGNEPSVMFANQRQKIKNVGLRTWSRGNGAKRPKLRVEMRSIFHVSEGRDLHIAEKRDHFQLGGGTTRLFFLTSTTVSMKPVKKSHWHVALVQYVTHLHSQHPSLPKSYPASPLHCKHPLVWKSDTKMNQSPQDEHSFMCN